MATKTRSTPAPAPPAAETAPATLEERALSHLKVLALESILSSSESLRITDLARLVVERLGVPFDEHEAGGLASVIRLLLDSDPRFAQSSRRWDLAMRMGRADADRKKPVERSIEDFIDLFGVPASATQIASLTAAQYGRDVEYFRGMIERLAPTRPQFFLTPDGTIGITRWLLAVESDDRGDVLFDNFESPQAEAEAETVAQLAEGATASGALELANAIAARSPAPVPFKPLAFAAWTRFPDAESQALFNDLLADDRVTMLPGPAVATAEQYQQLLEAIRTLARNPESVASMVAAAVPAEEEAVSPPAISAADADIDQVYDSMERDPFRSYRASELCQEVLETFPGSRSYQPIHDSLIAKMRSDARFTWVGNERFRIAGSVPDEVQILPEGLAFDERTYAGPDGEPVDKLSRPETWKYNLEQEVTNLLVLDVGDDDSQPGAAPARLRKSLLLHHYFAGTAYVPHAERRFFPLEPDLIELTLITPTGERLECWFNHRLGLLYGLRTWFEALDARNELVSWSGPVFHVVPTNAPDEFRLEYSGEIEPMTLVEKERLPQLFGVLRAEAETEEWPLTTVVSRIMRDYPEGLPFVSIFTQVNIVRRSRRDAVASVLSGQRLFTQNPQQPGYIRYDEKRAEKKGKKRGPRRFEDYEEEEDLEIE